MSQNPARKSNSGLVGAPVVPPADAETTLAELAEIVDRIAEVSHRINNPLTSLVGRSQLLRRQESDPQKVSHAAAEIETAAGRVADYMRELRQVIRGAQQVARRGSGA